MVYAVLDPATPEPSSSPMPDICCRLFIDDQGEHFIDIERGLPLGLAAEIIPKLRFTFAGFATDFLQRRHYRSGECGRRRVRFVPARGACGQARGFGGEHRG